MTIPIIGNMINRGKKAPTAGEQVQGMLDEKKANRCEQEADILAEGIKDLLIERDILVGDFPDIITIAAKKMSAWMGEQVSERKLSDILIKEEKPDDQS